MEGSWEYVEFHLIYFLIPLHEYRYRIGPVYLAKTIQQLSKNMYSI
jgi:hypothetical protein